MSGYKASEFLKKLSRLNFKFEVMGTSNLALLFIFLVYVICEFIIHVKSDLIIPVVLVLFVAFHRILIGVFLFNFRCPHCDKSFFGDAIRIFPVHEQEKCWNCGISLKEIENAAGEKLDIIKR